MTERDGDGVPVSPDKGRAVTAGELREALDGLDDTTLIAVYACGAWNWAYTIKETARSDDEHPVVVLKE